MRPEVKYTSESDLESVFSIEEPKTSSKEPPISQKYVCTFPGCGLAFMRVVSLDRHEFKHTGIEKHKCFHEGCSRAYTNTQSLKRHLKVFHEKLAKNIKCSFDFCEKMFVSLQNMNRHIREVHEDPRVYKCGQCEEKFKQKVKLRRHEVKHTGVHPYNCSTCSKGFVQEYFLLRHVCGKTHTCDKCEETFKKWTELVAHRKTHVQKTVYKCDLCSKEFSTNFFLKEHKNTHEDDKEVFKCTYEGCERFYTYRRNLLQHVRTFHEGKRFECTAENCGASLTDKRTLENHIKKIHNKQVADKPKPKNSKKPRATRKDAGRPKQSTLSKLSGVFIEKEIDQMIIDGTAEVEIDLPALEEEMLGGVDSEC